MDPANVNAREKTIDWLYSPGITAAHRVLLDEIRLFLHGPESQKTGYAFPAQDELAYRLGAGEKTVRRHLRDLVNIGLLLLNRPNKRLNNEYRLPDEIKDFAGSLVSPRRHKKKNSKKKNSSKRDTATTSEAAHDRSVCPVKMTGREGSTCPVRPVILTGMSGQDDRSYINSGVSSGINSPMQQQSEDAETASDGAAAVVDCKNETIQDGAVQDGAIHKDALEGDGEYAPVASANTTPIPEPAMARDDGAARKVIDEENALYERLERLDITPDEYSTYTFVEKNIVQFASDLLRDDKIDFGKYRNLAKSDPHLILDVVRYCGQRNEAKRRAGLAPLGPAFVVECLNDPVGRGFRDDSGMGIWPHDFIWASPKQTDWERDRDASLARLFGLTLQEYLEVDHIANGAELRAEDYVTYLCVKEAIARKDGCVSVGCLPPSWAELVIEHREEADQSAKTAIIVSVDDGEPPIVKEVA